MIELSPSDVVEHCKRRRSRDGVSPATQQQDIGFLSEVLRTARACQKLGIQNLHFHDLRHEGTSRLFASGNAVPEVALCTGRKDWKMLARYTRLQAQDLHR